MVVKPNGFDPQASRSRPRESPLVYLETSGLSLGIWPS